MSALGTGLSRLRAATGGAGTRWTAAAGDAGTRWTAAAGDAGARMAAAMVHRGDDWIRRRGQLSRGRTGRYRFAHFGEGTRIGFPVGCLFNTEWISLGSRTLVGEHVSLTAGMAPCQDLGDRPPLLWIGDACVIGRGSHIVAHESVRIGGHVYVAPYVYITDQNHGYTALEEPIGLQIPANRPVVVGDGCWIGTGVIILPGTRLGRNVAVAGGAVVRGTFPDHCVIGGVPARVLRRYEPGTGWRAVDLDRTRSA
ncbi:acyltransferase [Streptomyces sp. NPDC051940]|uniref:acyltransferase n=1 Tax=Streptomyces sp. NPDC051940 TaxID=3155675 RepID=UPI00343F43AC